MVEEGNEKFINMVYLCIVGFYVVNGVVKIYLEILKISIFKDFYEMYFERFYNKINGIILC